MTRWSFVSLDVEHTRALARELGRAIGADGLVLALVGPLGAGKTAFVKGLAEGLGVEPRAVSSPTFVIAQQYALPAGPEVLHHVDLYRLESEEELEGIGFDDLLAPGGVLAVEWADRFPERLGDDVLRVEFEGPGSSGAAPRRMHVEAPESEKCLAHPISLDWRQRVEALEARRARDAGRGAPKGDGLILFLIAGLTAISAAGDAREFGWFEPPRESGAVCARVLPADDGVPDAFGTRRLQCAEEGRPQVPSRRVEGVARLLIGEKMDVDRVTARQLERLPGIGPSRAAAIVAHRETRAFERPQMLEGVPGIGPALRRKLEPWLAFPSSHRGGEGDD